MLEGWPPLKLHTGFYLLLVGLEMLGRGKAGECFGLSVIPSVTMMCWK